MTRFRHLPFRALDIAIIGFVLIISLVPLAFILRSGEEASIVVISWHGDEVYRNSISVDAVYVTPDGLNTIVIQNGEVWMQSAECHDGLCMLSGHATPSRPIICLPNAVIVRIIGEKGVDGATW